MVESQRKPKPNQKRFSNGYRTKTGHTTSYQAPRFRPHEPQRTFYQPPVQNNYAWREQQPQRPNYGWIPQPNLFQMQQQQAAIIFNQQQFSPNFNRPQPNFNRQPQQPLPIFNRQPVYQNGLPPPVPIRQSPVQSLPHEPLPYRKDHCESREEIPVRPVIPEPERIEVVSNDDSIEKEIEEMANHSMEAEISMNDSSSNSYGTEVRELEIFEPSERPGPREKALPKFDLNDPILYMNMKSRVLHAGDRIERQQIPTYLQNGKPFGLFVSEVNTPAKFWFHLKDDSPILDELMNDLE